MVTGGAPGAPAGGARGAGGDAREALAWGGAGRVCPRRRTADVPAGNLRQGERVVARQPNYGFEKRKKEMDRKSKKEEKQQRKRERAEAQRESEETPRPDDATPPQGE